MVPFDRPVLTAGGTDSPLPAFENRAVRYFPVVAAARDGREAGRGIVPHIKRQIFHAPIISITLQQVIRRHPVDL